MPKIGNGLVLLIRVGNFIRLKLLFEVYLSSFFEKVFHEYHHLGITQSASDILRLFAYCKGGAS